MYIKPLLAILFVSFNLFIFGEEVLRLHSLKHESDFLKDIGTKAYVIEDLERQFQKHNIEITDFCVTRTSVADLADCYGHLNRKYYLTGNSNLIIVSNSGRCFCPNIEFQESRHVYHISRLILLACGNCLLYFLSLFVGWRSLKVKTL